MHKFYGKPEHDFHIRLEGPESAQQDIKFYIGEHQKRQTADKLDDDWSVDAIKDVGDQFQRYVESELSSFGDSCESGQDTREPPYQEIDYQGETGLIPPHP